MAAISKPGDTGETWCGGLPTYHAVPQLEEWLEELDLFA
jgi:hypothetical protein